MLKTYTQFYFSVVFVVFCAFAGYALAAWQWPL